MVIDRVLTMLTVGECSVEEIATALKIDNELALKIATFLVEFNFVEKHNSKLRITEAGLKFLRI